MPARNATRTAFATPAIRPVVDLVLNLLFEADREPARLLLTPDHAEDLVGLGDRYRGVRVELAEASAVEAPAVAGGGDLTRYRISPPGRRYGERAALLGPDDGSRPAPFISSPHNAASLHLTDNIRTDVLERRGSAPPDEDERK